MAEPGNGTIWATEYDEDAYVRIDDAVTADGEERWYELVRDDGRWVLNGEDPISWVDPDEGPLDEQWDLHQVHEPGLVERIRDDIVFEDALTGRVYGLAERLLDEEVAAGPVVVVVSPDGRGGLRIGGITHPAHASRRSPSYLGVAVEPDQLDWDDALAAVGLIRARGCRWTLMRSDDYFTSCTWISRPRTRMRRRLIALQRDVD